MSIKIKCQKCKKDKEPSLFVPSAVRRYNAGQSVNCRECENNRPRRNPKYNGKRVGLSFGKGFAGVYP